MIIYYYNWINDFVFVLRTGKLPVLNHFIKHYTPAEYDRDGLREQHRRMRRDAAAGNRQQSSPMRLAIVTPHRLVTRYFIVIVLFFQKPETRRERERERDVLFGRISRRRNQHSVEVKVLLRSTRWPCFFFSTPGRESSG